MERARILVIEDQKYLREIVVEVLTDAGYPTVGLAGALEALDGLPILRPDLIIMDMTMPGMNGAELLGRLRADARWAGIPVVIVSALAEGARVDHPGVSVLGKPFDAATLLEHTKRMIGPPVLPERDPTPPRLPRSRRRA